MSSSIDQRIVEMQFNNQQFEAAVSQTLSSLDSLKNSLNVLGSAEALEDLADVDTSGIKSLSDEVDKSSSKFSVLEEIAVGALRKIGEMAITAGKNLAQNLTNTLVLDNITAGWQKYADKSESVQTIMAATREELAASGNQMEVVNEELKKLNWFTDETSFNFTDMTSNIGKFTSAGVGLEESTKAMMGISTWAAASGANINQASHAMYNLSQAMGVGAVTLADWKSIENANMATIEFKKTALETAVAEGTLVKVNEDLYKTLDGTEVTVTNFRETLTEDKWLDSNVLIKTLDKYGSYASKLADGQSELNGLTDDYYETTSKLLKDVDRYIDGTLDLNAISKETGASVADLTEQFDLLSKSEDDLGRRAFRAAQEATTFQQAIDAVKDAASTTWMNIFEDVFGDYEHAKVLWTDLSNALWDTFVGPLANLEEVVGSWSEQGGNAFAIEGVINLWEAFSSVLGAVGEALGELFPPLTAERLVDLTRAFRDFTADLIPSEETLEGIKSIVLGLVEPFKFLLSIVKSFITTIFPPLISLGAASVSTFFKLASIVGGAVANAFVYAGEKVGKIFTALNNVKVVMFSQLSNPLKRISEAISRIFDTIVDKVKGLDIFKNLGDKVTGFTDLLVKNISKWGFDKWMTGSFKDFGDMVATAFENAADAIEKYDLNGKVNDIVTFLSSAFAKARETLIGFDIASKATSIIETITASYHTAIDKIQEFVESHEKLQSVVNWFKDLKDKVKEAIDQYGILGTIFGGIELAVTTVANAFQNVFNYVKNSGLFDIIATGFQAAYNTIRNVGTLLYSTFSPYVSAAISGLREFFSNLKGADVQTFVGGFNNLRTILSKPKELLKSLVKIIGNLINKVKEFFNQKGRFEKIKSFLEAVKPIIGAIADKIKTALAGADYEKIADIIIKLALAIAKIKFLTGTGNAFTSFFAALSTSFGDLGSSIATFLATISTSVAGLFNNLSSTIPMLMKSISGYFNRKGKQPIGVTILEIAAAIAILAGSLWLLAQVPQEKINSVMITLLELVGIVVGMAAAISGINKLTGGNSLATGGGLLLMIASIVAIIGVIKLIAVSGISYKTVTDNLEAFVVIFGILGAVLLASNLAGKNAAKAGVGLILISAAIAIMVAVIKAIAKISITDLEKGMKVIEEFLLVFALVTVASIASGKNASKAGTMLIKMSIAIGILTICIKSLADMSAGDLNKAVKAISELMVVMGLVVALTGLASGSGKGLGAMTLVIVAITASLAILAFFDSDKLLQGAKSLGLVLAALAVSFAVINKTTSTSKKMLKTVLMMGLIMGEIVLALALLSKLDTNESITNAVVLSAVMVVLVGVFKQFSKITATTKKMKTTVALMAAVLVTIAGALWLLGQNDWNENLTNALALSAVLYVLVGVFKQLKGMNASLGQCAVVAAFLGVILAEIVGALYILGQFDSRNNLVNAVTLSAVLLAVSLVIDNLNNMSLKFTTALVAALEIGLILTEIVAALYVLGQFDAQDNLSNALALSAVLLAVSVAVGILALLPASGMITGALGAVASIGLLINGLAGVFAILGSWATDQRANIEGGIEIAKTVAHGLGEFVGNLITGIGDTVFGALPGYGENLSSFASNLEQFISVFSNAPDGIEGKVSGITKAILMLVGAEFLQAIAGWFTGITGGHSMAEFGTQLSEFADSFVGFINKLNGVNITDATTAATGIIETMVALAGEIPNSGGLLGYIMGENDIDDFGGRLETFAEHFVAFANTIKDIPDVTSQSATVKAAAECMLAIANAIPNEGGVIAEFFGDNTLDTFGEHMADFAESFVKFAKKIKDMPESVKTDAATVQQASECMVALANQLPNTGGVIGWIVGENDLDDFGAKMEAFAGHFVTFADTINDMPDDIVGKTESVEAAASILATFANTEIEKTGGLLQFFSGDSYQGLEDFGNGLKSLGVGLGGYYDQLKTIDLEAVEKSFNLFNAIIEVANLAMNTETSSLYNIVDGMRAIGTSVLSGFTSVFAGTDDKGVAEGMINAALDIFFGNFNTALDTKKELTVTFIKDTLGPNLVAAFDESMLTDDLEAIGTRVVEDIENGIIAEQDPDAVGVVEDLGQALTDAINEILPEGVWYDVGYNAAQGLAEGITAGTDAAVNAAVAMAQAVEAAAHVTLKINSPSRVFMGIGNYVVEGFVKGITDKQAYATSSVSSTFAAISSYIANSIDDNLDFSPVITPVLDLTNLEKGSAAMDSMFGQRNLSGYAVTGPENVNIQDDAINRLVMGMDKFINSAQNEPQPPINIYVTGGNNADANEIADVVMDKLNVELHRRRAAMA